MREAGLFRCRSGAAGESAQKSSGLFGSFTVLTGTADERVIDPLRAAGRKIVIPSKSNRKKPRLFDREVYRARHLIENVFCKLEQFRGIATRCDKLARNVLAAIYLATTIIWLN